MTTHMYDCFSYTLIGINLGVCGVNKPEVYTNFLLKDVSTWISDVAKPYAEKSICSTYEGFSIDIKVYNFSYITPAIFLGGRGIE